MQRELLDALLRALAPNAEQAGSAYPTLHARLMRFFSLNRVADPASLADEAMDRLARRVAAPEREEIGSLNAFALGIAHHLLQEETRKQIRMDEAAHDWTVLHGAPDDSHELLLQALDHCLDRMRAEQQQLLRTYYQWTGREKIAHHRQLAESLGLNLNALRNRIMRARQELDACVRMQARDITTKRSTEKWKDRRP